MLLIFLLCSVALIARAVNLQVMETDFLQGQGKARFLREVTIASTRGVITDRNGEPLAVSTPVDSIWVHPGQLLEYPEKIKPLADLLKADAEEIERKLTQRASKEFVWLRRRLNPALADQIRALKIPGVNLQKEYRRFYPTGEVTSHVIGFTNIDDIGQEGLELEVLQNVEPRSSQGQGSHRERASHFGQKNVSWEMSWYSLHRGQ